MIMDIYLFITDKCINDEKLPYQRCQLLQNCQILQTLKTIRSVHPSESVAIVAFWRSQLDEKGNVFSVNAD